MKKKIYNLKNLALIIKQKKKINKKIILCHGVYDVVHLGHIEHFKKAKSYGDILIVTTTNDKFINKGPNRPYFSCEVRKKFLESIEHIDYVSDVSDDSAKPAIELLKPNFYCKGVDYKKSSDDVTNKINHEVKLVKKYNGKFIITDEVTYSSTKILNDQNLILNKDQNKELINIKKNYDFEKIKNLFKKVKKLKILVVGETIIDKYHFCDSMGKSGKDPIMMFKKLNYENYLGGAGAIANHLAQYCNNVKLISMIGDDNKYDRFIKSKLSKNIKSDFLIRKNSQTIVKEKFIDKVSNSKVIGFYDFNDDELNQKDEKLVYNKLKKNIKNYDLMIVADYGHSLISNKNAKFISKSKTFLAVNSQINAANIHHHSLDNFSRTNLTIINEAELRHQLRDKNSSVKVLLIKLKKIIKSKFFVITMGSRGAIIYDCEKNRFIESASYASKVVDKIGSGDTMLSTLSIFLKISKDPSISILLASLAAAQNVSYLGNSQNTDPKKILKILQHLIS